MSPTASSVNGCNHVLSSMFIAVLCAGPALGQEGIIVRAGEGEPLMNGILMMLSPANGTSGPILAEQIFPPGGDTIVHAHDQGDELFYVVSGRGRARLGDRFELIGPRDAILVSPGLTHQVSNPFDDDLKVVFFMATAELAEQMRAFHERQTAEPDRPITSDEDAEFTERFGGSRTVSE